METKQIFINTTRKVDAFYKGIYSIIVFLTLSIFATILQVSLFVWNGMSINDHLFGDEGSWIIWLLTFTSLISSLLSLTANIFSQRLNKNFVYFQVTAILLGLINMAMTAAYFVAVTQIFIIGLSIFRYHIWSKDESSTVEVNHNTKKNLIKIFSIWIVFLIILTTIIIFFGETIYGGPKDDITGEYNKPVWTWYLDAFASSIIVLSALLLIIKNKFGFLAKTIGPLCGVAIFIEAGQLIMIINLSILASMNFTSFLTWLSREMEK